MRISVVIPTLGRPAMLLETLESVLACDPAPHEILVVDGDANRSAREAVNQLPGNATTAPVRCLASPRGASVQRNRGIEVATGDVVLFIDDDAIVDPGLIGVLCATYRDPEIVGVTGRIIQGDYRAFGNQRSRIRQLLMRGGRQGTMTSYGYPRHLQELDRRWDVEFMQGMIHHHAQAILMAAWAPTHDATPAIRELCAHRRHGEGRARRCRPVERTRRIERLRASCPSSASDHEHFSRGP